MSTHTDVLSIANLRRFSPFNLLDETLLETFVGYCQEHRLAAGEKLFCLGDQDSNDYYLLSGKIKLTNAQGQDSFIEAGLPNSNQPLSRTRPRRQTAIACNEVQCFVINTSVLAELNRTTQNNKDYLSIMAMGKPIDDDGDALLHQFQHDLNRGNFNLPSFPDVAFKITRLVEYPDCSIDDVVKLIHSDPAIAAKIILTANSALYRGVNNCSDIKQAVMRLGLMTTKQLVISFSLLGLFEADSVVLKQKMALLRQQSIHVAAFNAVLARHFLSLNTEQAMLAGLLNQLGEMIVLSYAEQFHEFDHKPMQLAVVLSQLASSAGILAAQQWGFSQPLIDVVAQSSNWLHASGDDFSYTDLTLIAKYLCLMSPVGDTTLPENSTMPALQKALQLHDASALLEIIQNSQQSLNDIKTLLS